MRHRPAVRRDDRVPGDHGARRRRIPVLSPLTTRPPCRADPPSSTKESTREHQAEAQQRRPAETPRNDQLTVIYPDSKMTLPPDGADLDTWFEQHPPEIKSEAVTRDEFMRRMAP